MHNVNPIVKPEHNVDKSFTPVPYVNIDVIHNPNVRTIIKPVQNVTQMLSLWTM